jgi:hypothetical protein
MIRFIMSLFGYSKIPLEAVRLSIRIEYYLEGLDFVNRPEASAEFLNQAKEGAKALTEYLRSCRLIQGER